MEGEKNRRKLTVLVLNSKGGCGKSTIATNLAGYYAAQGHVTALKDYDPQGSSSEWLRQRSSSRPPIHGISAFRTSSNMTRAWQMRLPGDISRVVIDSPAAVDLPRMVSVLRDVDKIVVPILPSPIDIRASAMFIHSFLRFVRSHPCRADLCVVASRVPGRSQAFATMQRIFNNLEIPLRARLSENEHYIHAAEHGVSLLELDDALIGEDKREWRPLLDWLEDLKPAQVPSNVVTLLAN